MHGQASCEFCGENSAAVSLPDKWGDRSSLIGFSFHFSGVHKCVLGRLEVFYIFLNFSVHFGDYLKVT